MGQRGYLHNDITLLDSEDPQQSVDILKSQTDFGRVLLAAGLDPDLLALIVNTLRNLPS